MNSFDLLGLKDLPFVPAPVHTLLYQVHEPRNLDDVCGQRETIAALRHWASDANRNHRLALVGPCGSGKTMLIRLLVKTLLKWTLVPAHEIQPFTTASEKLRMYAMRPPIVHAVSDDHTMQDIATLLDLALPSVHVVLECTQPIEVLFKHDVHIIYLSPLTIAQMRPWIQSRHTTLLTPVAADLRAFWNDVQSGATSAVLRERSPPSADDSCDSDTFVPAPVTGFDYMEAASIEQVSRIADHVALRDMCQLNMDGIVQNHALSSNDRSWSTVGVVATRLRVLRTHTSESLPAMCRGMRPLLETVWYTNPRCLDARARAIIKSHDVGRS